MEKIIAKAFAPVLTSVQSENIAGAVLGVCDKEGNRAVLHNGLAQKIGAHRPMKRETVFDLASVSKVIFTATAIMKLVAAGKIALDNKLAMHIPDLRQYDKQAAERDLTIEQCLAHATFLPAVEPIYTLGLSPLTMRAYILQRDWKKGPSVYSDINFMLLGIVIERVTGLALIDQETPNGTTFRPDPLNCAATEFCTWRNRIICGEVHDENAYAMGGAAGHAGLFGTIDNVLDFASDLLNYRALPEGQTKMLFEPKSRERALGWEIKYDNWSGGHLCADNTIGHTGFTGTGLWIDPKRGISWALLTNRVHPSRHTDSGIMQLRRDVGNALISAFDC